jgi:carbohydrate-selective porin OprB
VRKREPDKTGGHVFDLAELGVWSDAVARLAMSDRTGRSTAADYTGSYFAYQEIYGQGPNLRFDEISIEKCCLRKLWPSNRFLPDG